MTLDSSVLVAILLGESGHLSLVDRILEATSVRVGAPTVAETALVFAGRTGWASTGIVEALLRELSVTIAPFGDQEWRAAADAFLRFGRGRHKAALNFGDCMAYASAAVAHDSLLFVGDDFSHTDLPPA